MVEGDVFNNAFYSTISEIRRNVTPFLEHEPQAIIDRLCLRLEDGYLKELL